MDYYDEYMDALFDKDILTEHLRSIIDMPEIQEILKKTHTYNNAGEKTKQSYYDLLKATDYLALGDEK